MFYFPADTNLGANLIAALTGLDVNNLTHFESSSA
jgi:hypothetical protein